MLKTVKKFCLGYDPSISVRNDVEPIDTNLELSIVTLPTITEEEKQQTFEEQLQFEADLNLQFFERDQTIEFEREQASQAMSVQASQMLQASNSR